MTWNKSLTTRSSYEKNYLMGSYFSCNINTIVMLKEKNSKYDSVISDLRSELAVKGDSKLTFDNYEWSYKVVHNVTNADISKGDMIEVYPKKERDSKRLFNINIDS